jgi:hypothetical protein
MMNCVIYKINMKTGKSIIDYQKTKKEISSTHTIDENYNDINPNKSFQPTAGQCFDCSYTQCILFVLLDNLGSVRLSPAAPVTHC